jgi:hypothetical protein
MAFLETSTIAMSLLVNLIFFFHDLLLLAYNRYVVKTSDNAESVKLQYRSLAKVADGNGPSGLVPSNVQSTSWL